MSRYCEPEGADYCDATAHDYDAEGVCGRCGAPAPCEVPGDCDVVGGDEATIMEADHGE